MRNTIISAAVMAAVTSTAWGQAQSVNTVDFLNQRIPEVSFDGAPFEQVVSFIENYTQTNVVVRWQTLEDMGIDRDKPISISVKNLRVSQVLWMMMIEAGGSDVKLAYRASGNLLVLSTAEDLGQEMLLRVYDVSDLLVRVPRFTNSPRIDLTQISQTAGGGGGQSIFGGSSGSGGQDDDDNQSSNNQENDEEAQRLVDLITSTVEPNSWEVNGGLGSIRAFGRQLVVRNNILVQQQLGGAVLEED